MVLLRSLGSKKKRKQLTRRVKIFKRPHRSNNRSIYTYISHNKNRKMFAFDAIDADTYRHSDVDQFEASKYQRGIEYGESDTDVFEDSSNGPDGSINDLMTLDDDNYSNSGSDRKTHTLTAKLREESLQICSLLPKFGYHFMYNMLYKNRCAVNRVELVLWDLLPEKRPKANWIPKNQCTGNNFKKKSIAPIKIVEKEWNLIQKNVTAADKSNSVNRSENKNTTLVGNKRKANDTVSGTNLLQNYLRYLRYMKQNKWMKLSGKGQHYNMNNRNDIRHRILKTGWANKPNRNISQPVHKNQVQRAVGIDEDCYIDAGNDSDDTKDTCTRVKLSGAAEPRDAQQSAVSSETEDLDSVSSDINDPFAKIKLEDMLGSSSKRDGNTRGVAYPSVQPSKINHNTVQGKKLQKSHTDIDRGSQEEVNEDIENRYAYLSGVFPKADPAYLKKVVHRLPDDPNAVTQFVQAQLENPTYLTHEEKKDRLHITQQQRQYTVAFDVKQFLEIFPDPFKQFENPRRKCTENPDAIVFLKSHFTLFRSTTIMRLYQKHNYNLYFTAQELEYTFPDRETARADCSWEKDPSNNVPLLQECAFIKHIKKIREHLDKSREEEAKEFKKLKGRNELLECQCCYSNECMPSKCSSCRDGHVFCNSCIIKGTEVALAQGVTRIKCFANCDYDFSISTLQNILRPTQFSALIRKKQEEEVTAAALDGLVSCPFCHFASIPPPDDKVFKCFNPECMKESCRLCKELNHVPLKCNEKSENARLFLEEKMTEAYLRKCYRCHRPYVKTGGCNKVSCTCGALMCYLCDKPITDYNHFSNGNCPLHSNDGEINERTVQAVAKKTVEFIQAKDPKIKIDPKLIDLPNVARVTHNIQDDSTISNRVNKVAEFSTYKYA